MFDFFSRLLDTSDFPRRWYCGTWSSAHGWTHIIADVAIFGAYLAIPFALAYFVRRRTDVPFPRMFWLFCGFITFCGFSHLIEATIFWQPWYRLSALVKVGTAIVSWVTVLGLLPVIPAALAFRSPRELEAEVSERTRQLADVNEVLSGKNEELEQFIYSISHDLKTPLVTARGFLGALQEELQPDPSTDVADSITRIDKATSRMAELLDDLLHLSRIGRTRQNPQHVDLNAVVQDVAELLKPQTAAVGCTIRTDGELPTIHFDPNRLRQLLENLLSNAVKYGTDGACKEISVAAGRNDTEFLLQVVDHGRGVPESMREQVFLPFERLQADKEGTGIGLAVVARIVAVVGGRVKIEDTPGGGATVTIVFPAEAVTAEAL